MMNQRIIAGHVFIIALSSLLPLTLTEESQASNIKNQEELVKYLKEKKFIRNYVVEDVMKRVDRKDFVEDSPYDDLPQDIGYNATISAPYLHAFALEKLRKFIKPGSKVMDIGCGSGYLTACMGLMLGNKGEVIGMDHIPELVEQAKKNIRKSHPELLDKGIVRFVVGDGRVGLYEERPFDAIFVAGSVMETPEILTNHLRRVGRMLIPVEHPGFGQSLTKVDKDIYGLVIEVEILTTNFTPLTDKEKQCPQMAQQ